MVARMPEERQRVAELLDAALRRINQGEAEALYTARDLALTRFANSRIHQNVAQHDATLRVRLMAEDRTGVASTNRLDPDGIDEVVARAEALLDAEVDVIVVARGGGSVEDLLPFSDEALIRAVHRARTPLVSAIGHEPDQPLLDLVADVRASTPTDAAKLVVPDVSEELRGVGLARQRIRTAVTGFLAREQAGLDALRSRPALAYSW